MDVASTDADLTHRRNLLQGGASPPLGGASTRTAEKSPGTRKGVGGCARDLCTRSSESGRECSTVCAREEPDGACCRLVGRHALADCFSALDAVVAARRVVALSSRPRTSTRELAPRHRQESHSARGLRAKSADGERTTLVVGWADEQRLLGWAEIRFGTACDRGSVPGRPRGRNDDELDTVRRSSARAGEALRVPTRGLSIRPSWCTPEATASDDPVRPKVRS